MTTTAALPLRTCTMLFTRNDSMKLDAAAFLQFRTFHDDQTAHKAFDNAVTYWVAHTEKGKQVWEHSGKDLNVGDLLGHDAFADPVFIKILQLNGLEYLNGHGFSEVEHISYDHVLVDSSQLPEDDPAESPGL
jgi:hypothetical protein